MEILFNKNNDGANELKELTSSYYANNQFDKIKQEIMLQTEILIELIGLPIYNLALQQYNLPPELPNESNVEESIADDEPATQVDLDELVQHIQLPIALLASLEFYKTNIISHEDSGRKVKLNNANEKMPWEWMFDRDDEAHQGKANRAVDRLIKFLDASQLTEWVNSPAQLATRKLFVNNAKMFNQIYPIDNSGAFYHKLTPFIAEVQRTKIKPILGRQVYADLLAYHQSLGFQVITESVVDDSTEESFADVEEDLELLLPFVQNAIPMLAMAIAIERLSLSVMPNGLVQEFKSMMQTRSASQPAMDETIRRFQLKFDRSAKRALNELKQQLNAMIDYDDYPLLPENPETQKFFRT